ncbi:MAG: DUF1491 family protein [Pseudomonadota bacterium]
MRMGLDDDGLRPRLKSALWVDGYMRRCRAQGAFASLSRRGDQSAGAIFIEVLHSEGTDLLGPAPGSNGRVFERLVVAEPGWVVAERLQKEMAFDADLWVVTVEDPKGRTFLERDEGG